MSHHTERIYDQAMAECFGNMKQLRDQWTYQPKNGIEAEIVKYDELWGKDSEQYSFIKSESNNLITQMLYKIVCDLLREYGHIYEPHPIARRNNVLFHSSEMNVTFPLLQQPLDDAQALIVTHSDGGRTLYLFKGFGINNRVPGELVAAFRQKLSVDDYKYISWVEKQAYAEVLDHNDDEDDPARGTDVYSLAYFFETYFDGNEFSVFTSKFNDFKKKIHEYFGISIVKTLHPNVIFTYREDIREDLLTYDYESGIKRFSTYTLTEAQKKAIETQFFSNDYLNALISHSNYAKCFITAEWLYQSLYRSAGAIDLTSISMGYFKAMEQFLYSFVGLHTSELDGVRREISFYNGQKDVFVRFTNDVHKKKKNSLTLGNMAKYLKNRDNLDLLRPEINTTTINILRDILTKISNLRNGYFHKENTNMWEKVEKDRALAHVVFYFLLGAYRYTMSERTSLGIDLPINLDQYDKLFGYVNRRMYAHSETMIPIIYLGEVKDKNDFWMICPDEKTFYGTYGEPYYSGIYLRRWHERNSSFAITTKDFYDSIFEGALVIGKNGIMLSGPETLLFSQGQFLGKSNPF